MGPAARGPSYSAALAPRATEVQRVWRGVLARRAFSDLLFDAIEAQLGEESVETFLCDEAPSSAPSTPRRHTPSLEEALELASHNKFLHFTPGSDPHASRPAVQRHVSLTGGGRAEPPLRRPTPLRSAHHAEPADSGGDALEFTEEMAESMSTEALKELVAVLTRIIGTRNRELVALLERRDELQHARDYRQATVARLVSQVDRSQYTKQKRRGAAKLLGRKSM